MAHVHVREVTCDDSSSTNTGSPASASAGPSQARAEAVRASVQVDPNVALARSAGVPGPRTAGINLESPDVEVRLDCGGDGGGRGAAEANTLLVWEEEEGVEAYTSAVLREAGARES